MKPNINKQLYSQKVEQGPDDLFTFVVDKTLETIGGQLDASTMAQLNPNQVTLLGYHLFREEVLDGGFVQLIHNGLGPFIFLNPFAKAVRLWGNDIENEEGDGILLRFSKLIYKGRKLYERYGSELTGDMTDEEFMALFEQYPEFDDLDDGFIEMEEDLTSMIAAYIIKNNDEFLELVE